MLILWDCGFHSYAMCERCQRTGAHFLGRVPAQVRLPPVRRLADGSYLAYLHPSRRPRGDRLLVRVIDYTVDDPRRPHHAKRHRLVTSLLDATLAPADEVAVHYHERWEVELVVAETDTHQRRPLRPFRSRTPLGVLQEVYGLFLAHYAVFQSQIVAPAQTSDWYQRLVRDIGRGRLPRRDNRCNPRVVKRKMSKFDLKREPHRHWPQPTKTFADAIVLLI